MIKLDVIPRVGDGILAFSLQSSNICARLGDRVDAWRVSRAGLPTSRRYEGPPVPDFGARWVEIDRRPLRRPAVAVGLGGSKYVLSEGGLAS
jgi:hypothetical protein